MRKRSLLFILFTFSYLFNLAQTRTKEYAIGSYPQDCYSLIQASDGTYVLCGVTGSYGQGDYDVYVVKMDTTGNALWTRTVGGLLDDYGYSIVQTFDKGFAITGYTKSFGQGKSDVYVVILDSSGNLNWTKTIGGSQADIGYSIIQTKDSGFVIGGITCSFGVRSATDTAVYLIKLNKSGNLQWTKTIGGLGSDNECRSIIQTSDDGYVIAGWTNSFGVGVYNGYIIKLDGSGNLIWAKTVGGTKTDAFGSIVQTNDGGYVAAGYTTSYGDTINGDVYVVKIDSIGNLIWTRTIGGDGIDDAISLTKSSDGGFVFAGITWSFGNPNGYFYVGKLDSVGNVKWTRSIGGTKINWANSIVSRKEGGYAVAGVSTSINNNSLMFLAELDSIGNACSLDSSGGAISNGGIVSTGGIIDSGGVVGTGGLADTGGEAKVVCGAISGIDEINTSISEISIYPNPVSNVCTITSHSEFDADDANCSIWIMDMTGRIILTCMNSHLITNKLIINVSSFQSGMYFIKIQTNKTIHLLKFIKQ